MVFNMFQCFYDGITLFFNLSFNKLTVLLLRPPAQNLSSVSVYGLRTCDRLNISSDHVVCG